MTSKRRGVALLSILVLILTGLTINKVGAGEQTRFYGPDGRSIGTATTSGNTTTFYGADGRRTGSAATYAPLALGRKKLGAARSPRGGRARDRMLLIPVPEACKV